MSLSGTMLMLLLLFGIWLISTAGMIIVLVRRLRRCTSSHRSNIPYTSSACFVLWPGSWLAIKSQETRAIQSALGLHDAHACSWLEGLAAEGEVFITPPTKGWSLVLGTALPEPWEDVDASFRLLMELSRELGPVQFFSASRISLHHAWVKAEYGRIIRAYAWADKTLWNQGPETSAETELGLHCYGYTDPEQTWSLAQADEIRTNVERVPLLAARWGFDPRWIDERSLEKQRGVVGKLSRAAGTASGYGWQA